MLTVHLLSVPLSPLDYMFYTRGSADEFNKLARVSGDHEWSWPHMIRYIKKVGLRVPDMRHRLTQYDATFRRVKNFHLRQTATACKDSWIHPSMAPPGHF